MIVPLVISFIITAILLLIGTVILGGTQSGLDCSTLSGGNSTATTDAPKYPAGTWAGACHDTETSAQSAFSLLVVILIIISAAVILYVVRTFA